MGPDSAATGSATLSVKKVFKSYGRIKALAGVSLELHCGEFIALLGQNGAGKSTLFQLLSGLFVADGGRILIGGHDISRNAVPALASLGIVFQQPTLDLELTVRANLRYHARLHGMDSGRTKAAIDEGMARLDLTDRADDRVRTLSGGNRRRVELARSLLHDPQILLMDEPTVGLDPASRRDILDHVLRLRGEKGIGILWATHLVEETAAADRIVVLHEGLVLRNDTPEGLVRETGAGSLEDAFLNLTGSGPDGAPAGPEGRG